MDTACGDKEKMDFTVCNSVGSSVCTDKNQHQIPYSAHSGFSARAPLNPEEYLKFSPIKLLMVRPHLILKSLRYHLPSRSPITHPELYAPRMQGYWRSKQFPKVEWEAVPSAIKLLLGLTILYSHSGMETHSLLLRVGLKLF